MQTLLIESFQSENGDSSSVNVIAGGSIDDTATWNLRETQFLWLKRFTLVNQDAPYYYSYYALYASSPYEIHVENCQIICTNGNCNSNYYSSSVIKVSFGYEGVYGNCHITNYFIKVIALDVYSKRRTDHLNSTTT